MHIAREYDTAAQANAAAKHLLEHGIVAGVVYTSLRRREVEPGLLGVQRPTLGAFRVLLANSKDTDDATLLLDAFDEDPIELDDDWEEQAEADVTLLAPEHAPSCPECGLVLPLEPGLTSCPACGATVDLAMLVAEQHGPEVLASTLSENDTTEWLDPDLLVAADLPCPRCKHPLGGLAELGTCPSCGTPYDKAALVRRLFAES